MESEKMVNKILNIKLENIKVREDISEEGLICKICNNLGIARNTIIGYKIIKKSIDARKKEDIFYNYSIIFSLTDDNKDNLKRLIKNKNIFIIKEGSEEASINISRKSKYKPVIVGAGPSGLFCAIALVEHGIKPIIVEQGSKVEDRKKIVEDFFKIGKLNTRCNVQFGEGGAGTFSDGKLTTNLHNPLCQNVLKTFVKFGAPEEVEYINKPHIGTDNLINIICNIRKYIINNGGEFLFDTRVEDFIIENNQIEKVICQNAKERFEIKTDTVVLAIGHSARDTFKTLYSKNIIMEKKNFSVGVRIEHKQEMINVSQYGRKTKLKLPPAEYKLAYHGKDRSCYTFCMCPGGVVIASSSEENTIVTNGMSKFARDGENANSAILVNVTPNDFKGDSPLEGMYFQQNLEEAAFKLGGSNYYAPIQKVVDFMNNVKTTEIGEVKPTYKPGVTLANLQEILPAFVTNTLKEGLIYFDTKIQGFANPDSILTGVETRSSSPVTIKRNEEKMSNIKGIYPCGEGAGYAGGIMSAAVDGIKVAFAIIEKE